MGVRKKREGGWTLGNISEDIGLATRDLDNSDLNQIEVDFSTVLTPSWY